MGVIKNYPLHRLKFWRSCGVAPAIAYCTERGVVVEVVRGQEDVADLFDEVVGEIAPIHIITHTLEMAGHGCTRVFLCESVGEWGVVVEMLPEELLNKGTLES